MTTTLPAHADTRDCRLYRFHVYHPDDMGLAPELRRVLIGYIGETAREPLARLLEHVYNQPWADTIVSWEVDPRVFAGKAAVLKAEQRAIITEKPLYNVEHNRGNRDRITPPKAIQQRRQRDAAKPFAQRWVHPDDRGRPARVPARTKPAPAPRDGSVRRWKRWQKHTLGWSIVWVVLTLTGWITLLVKHQGGWKQTGTIAAVASAAAVGVLARWVWLGCPLTKKAWRRAARNRRRTR